MNTNKRYFPVERERAVRLVFDQQGQNGLQWAAIESIANKIGCTPETLRRWVRRSETNQGKRSGMPSLTSNNSSMPEVAGDVGFLVDAENVNSIAAGLNQLITKKELKDQLSANAKKMRLGLIGTSR
jgi:transposase-like protein